MLIEDVACEVDKLADMSVDLIDMFERHGYGDASVFGHAMEGNMHLVFSQGFRNASDIDQFSRMMQVRSRRPAVPSRRRRDSCPSEEAVGGLFFDFEAIRTASSDRDAPRRRCARSSPSSTRVP